MAENYDNKLLLMWFCSPRAKFYMETWKWKAFLTKEYNVHNTLALGFMKKTEDKLVSYSYLIWNYQTLKITTTL